MKHEIAWIWMMAAVSAAAEDMVVSVQLCGGADVGMPDVVRAKHVAARIMASAGVRLEWCSAAKRCSHWDERLVVTLVPQAPSTVSSRVMADARVFEGHQIRIFMDHIAADIKGGYKAKAVGHILAHEITHLLQGCNRHASTGVMKAQFDDADYFVMSKKPLPFEAHDIDLIRMGWAKRRLLASN